MPKKRKHHAVKPSKSKYLFFSIVQNRKFITKNSINPKQGDFFGEMTFFTSCESKYSARSLTSSTIFFIKKEDFIKIIQNFPADFVSNDFIKYK